MTTSQQFNLRWNNHTNNLLQVFMDHFEKEQLVDVTLSCQGKFLKAHKLVLGACSPYFREIFDRHETTNHPVVILNGLQFGEIRSIVEFMYKGEVKVCESDLESLLATAENLQVKGLSNVRATRQGSSPSHQQANNNLTASSSSTSSISAQQNNISGLSSEQSSTLVNGSNPQSNSNQARNNAADEGTPLFRKRKRAKTTSPQKETILNDNSNPENSLPVKSDGKVSNEDENSDDLPLTIKIDPPHIRDIDEEEDLEMQLQKETLDASEGNSMDKKGMPEVKEKIPRPPNAFMIFANEWRRKLASQFTNESNKEISVRLGIMWKNLSGDSKEDYFAASRQANEEHKIKYPDYYYSPKEARLRKRYKMQQQQISTMMSSGQYNPVHLVKVFINDEGEGENQKAART